VSEQLKLISLVDLVEQIQEWPADRHHG